MNAWVVFYLFSEQDNANKQLKIIHEWKGIIIMYKKQLMNSSKKSSKHSEKFFSFLSFSHVKATISNFLLPIFEDFKHKKLVFSWNRRKMYFFLHTKTNLFLVDSSTFLWWHHHFADVVIRLFFTVSWGLIRLVYYYYYF